MTEDAVTPTKEAAALTRLPSLTALRIIAASLVFVSHGLIKPVFIDPKVNDGFLLLGRNAGTIGVAFFFILSGFVLTWSFKPTDSTGRFWRRRFFKIFPNHVVVYVIIVVVMLIAGKPITAGAALVSLPLLQAWWPNPSLMLFAVNGPTWSLSVELMFYLAFPLLLPLVNKIRPHRLWPWAGVVVGASLLMPLISRLLLPDHPMTFFSATVPWPQQWFVSFFPGTRMLEFVTGMVMARILVSSRWVGVRPIVPALLLAAGYAATVRLVLEDGLQAFLIIPLALLITAFAAADLNGRKTVLNPRAMVWLGEISYAFFVIHVMVFLSAHAAFSRQLGIGGMYEPHRFSTASGIVFLAGVYLLTVLLAWLLYTLVERPAMRRWSRPRRSTPLA